MIILSEEKQKRLLKCFAKTSLMRKKILFFILVSSILFTSGQVRKSYLKPYKIGVLYNYGVNENFIFDDPDYTYATTTYKLQAFYKLGTWKKLNFELIVQPQTQSLNHQLINKFFVTNDQENFEEKRVEFTKPKKMSLYGVEFGLVALKEITTKLYFQGGISLGFMSINNRTERLAKGFTFLENFTLGISYFATKKTNFYLGTNMGHVSNLNFQKPNDGYNILGLEIGFSYLLK